MSSEKKNFSLKDHLFNKEKVEYLAGLIKNKHPKFDNKNFVNNILTEFPNLELMERIYWIRENLNKFLLFEFEEVIDIFLSSIKTEHEAHDFIFAPFSDYIATYGCTKQHLEKSLSSLGEFTRYFSAEFAIRNFINTFPNETFYKMINWSKSKNEHQRRLASEGLRPKLPWGKSIKFNYKKGAEPLDNLFYDKSRYVTRSVANHLNDISKIDSDFVLNKLAEWKNSKRQSKDEMNFIINHSLRTLVKKGNIDTLKFLGYNTNPKLRISNLAVKKRKIKIGETLEFSFVIELEKNENLIIDYVVTYPTPHKSISKKVFKIKKLEAKKGKEIKIEKKHPFRKMTTKKLYSGKYELGIQINGKIISSKYFELET